MLHQTLVRIHANRIEIRRSKVHTGYYQAAMDNSTCLEPPKHKTSMFSELLVTFAAECRVLSASAVVLTAEGYKGWMIS